MAASPQFKVYDKMNRYQASAKEPHAAAILADHYDGTVRAGHDKVVWQKGVDISPNASLDGVTILIWSRTERGRIPVQGVLPLGC